MTGTCLVLKAKIESRGLSPHQKLEAWTELLFSCEKERKVLKPEFRIRCVNDGSNTAV